MSQPPVQPKRAHIACLNCRRRKMKCISDQYEEKPCERCIQKGLQCEYVPVAEEQTQSVSVRSPTPDSSSGGPSPHTSGQSAPRHSVRGFGSPSSSGVYLTQPYMASPQYNPSISQALEPNPSNPNARPGGTHSNPASYHFQTGQPSSGQYQVPAHGHNNYGLVPTNPTQPRVQPAIPPQQSSSFLGGVLALRDHAVAAEIE
ncbi:hypothetical protein B0H19DRAFT_1071119 [Mycena capillaripes]|nr:hypothetical protein B0H19DRAFT_1071119 [Mycena capillaripes]